MPQKRPTIMAGGGEVFAFIVRPPVEPPPFTEKVMLVTGRDVNDAYRTLNESLDGEPDYSARCVGAYTKRELDGLLRSEQDLPHHKAWAALEYIRGEYDLTATDRSALRRIQDRILAELVGLDRPSAITSKPDTVKE